MSLLLVRRAHQVNELRIAVDMDYSALFLVWLVIESALRISKHG